MKSRSRRGCAACLQQHKKCDESRPSCGRCRRLALDCNYCRDLRWFNGAQLPRAPRRGRSRPCTSLPLNSPEIPESSAGDQHRESQFTEQRARSPLLSPDELPFSWPFDAGMRPHADLEPHQPQATALSLAAASEESRTLDGLLMRSDIDSTKKNTGQSTDSNSEDSLDLGNTADTEYIASDRDEAATSLSLDASNAHQNSDHTFYDDGVLVPREATPLSGLIEANLGSLLFESNDSYLAYSYCELLETLSPTLADVNIQVVRSVALIIPGWAGARNGYKQIAKLALSSPVLLDTLISVSTVYMHLRGLLPQSVALRRQSQALSSLRKSTDTLSTLPVTSFQDSACLKRDILATVLLQITVEIANGSSVIQMHISYAFRLFQELGYDVCKPTSSVGMVLVQRLTYIDVLGSVFWQRRPLLPLNFWYFEQQEYQVDDSTPSFQETTGCPLWVISILASISHLVADMQDGAGQDTVLPRGMQLESRLTESALWHFGMSPNADTEETKHLDTVCECYYWSAVIILQRRIFHDSRTSTRVQYALTKLISLIESLPLGCGPDSQLSLALYVAAHVATIDSHRHLLRDKSSSLGRVYPLKTRSCLTEAFEKIWDASDAHGGTECDGKSPDPMKERALFIC